MILSRDGTFAQLMSSYPKTTKTEGQTSADLLEMIRDWRGRAERAHLERMWRDEFIDIKLKDELFQRFFNASRPISKAERQRLSTAPCERRMGSLAGNRWMMSHRIVWLFVSFWRGKV